MASYASKVFDDGPHKDKTYQEVFKTDTKYCKQALSCDPKFDNLIPKEFKDFVLSNFSISEKTCREFVNNLPSPARSYLAKIANISNSDIEVKQVHTPSDPKVKPGCYTGIYYRYFFKKCLYDMKKETVNFGRIEEFTSVFPFEVSKDVPKIDLDIIALLDDDVISKIQTSVNEYRKVINVKDTYEIFLLNIAHFKADLGLLTESEDDAAFRPQYPKIKATAVKRYGAWCFAFNKVRKHFGKSKLELERKYFETLPESNFNQLYSLLDTDFFTSNIDEYVRIFVNYLLFFASAIEMEKPNPGFYIDDMLLECVKSVYRLKSVDENKEWKYDLGMVALLSRRSYSEESGPNMFSDDYRIDDRVLENIKQYVEKLPIEKTLIDYKLTTYPDLPSGTILARVNNTSFTMCFSRRDRVDVWKFLTNILYGALCDDEQPIMYVVIYNAYLGRQSRIKMPQNREEIRNFIRVCNRFKFSGTWEDSLVKSMKEKFEEKPAKTNRAKESKEKQESITEAEESEIGSHGDTEKIVEAKMESTTKVEADEEKSAQVDVDVKGDSKAENTIEVEACEKRPAQVEEEVDGDKIFESKAESTTKVETDEEKSAQVDVDVKGDSIAENTIEVEACEERPSQVEEEVDGDKLFESKAESTTKVETDEENSSEIEVDVNYDEITDSNVEYSSEIEAYEKSPSQVEEETDGKKTESKAESTTKVETGEERSSEVAVDADYEETIDSKVECTTTVEAYEKSPSQVEEEVDGYKIFASKAECITKVETDGENSSEVEVDVNYDEITDSKVKYTSEVEAYEKSPSEVEEETDGEKTESKAESTTKVETDEERSSEVEVDVDHEETIDSKVECTTAVEACEESPSQVEEVDGDKIFESKAECTTKVETDVENSSEVEVDIKYDKITDSKVEYTTEVETYEKSPSEVEEETDGEKPELKAESTAKVEADKESSSLVEVDVEVENITVPKTASKPEAVFEKTEVQSVNTVQGKIDTPAQPILKEVTEIESKFQVQAPVVYISSNIGQEKLIKSVEPTCTISRVNSTNVIQVKVQIIVDIESVNSAGTVNPTSVIQDVTSKGQTKPLDVLMPTAERTSDCFNTLQENLENIDQVEPLNVVPTTEEENLKSTK